MVRKQKLGYYYYNEVENFYVKNCNEGSKNVHQVLAQNFVERIQELGCKNPCITLFFKPILNTIDHSFDECESPEDYYCMVSPERIAISRNPFLFCGIYP